MNYHIIGKYIRVVQPEDTVFFLGDLTIKRNSSFKPILADVIKNLPGKKHFIPGNHDYFTRKFYIEDCGFISMQRKIETKKYIMVHNPDDLTLDERYYGDKIVIHGHKHNHKSTRRRKRMFDIGVDGNNFYPINLKEISEIYKNIVDFKSKL